MHVPVNPLAELHRHHGFGFTGYQLVLSDRPGTPDDPPPAVAWLSAAFPAAEIVLIDDAVASAWKGRALRGTVHVDTRMDLWRLLAHAAVCIDLAPGASIARECIEALRFGTPIIVPDDSGPAALHAQAGGGATFGDPGELIDAVATLQDGANRSAASEAGRALRRCPVRRRRGTRRPRAGAPHRDDPCESALPPRPARTLRVDHVVACLQAKLTQIEQWLRLDLPPRRRSRALNDQVRANFSRIRDLREPPTPVTPTRKPPSGAADAVAEPDPLIGAPILEEFLQLDPRERATGGGQPSGRIPRASRLVRAAGRRGDLSAGGQGHRHRDRHTAAYRARSLRLRSRGLQGSHGAHRHGGGRRAQRARPSRPKRRNSNMRSC